MIMTFQVKDSGNRQEWGTGSKRDTNEGKPRYDLISVHALTRLAEHMAKGAKKYGERNWELGQPTNRYYESALRHLYMYLTDDSEDHLAAVLFNVMAIIHMQTEIEAGRLPEYLDDVYRRLPLDTDKILESVTPQYAQMLSDIVDEQTAKKTKQINEIALQQVALQAKMFGVNVRKVDNPKPRSKVEYKPTKPNPKDYIDNEHVNTLAGDMMQKLKYCVDCHKDTLPTKESALAPEHCSECDYPYDIYE